MEQISVLLASPNKGLLQSLQKIIELEEEITLVGLSDSKSETLELGQALDPQVIVLDFDMFRDNFEIGRHIQKTNPDARIIILSMYDFIGQATAKTQSRKLTHEIASVDWLSKRSNPAELLDLITKVRHERQIH